MQVLLNSDTHIDEGPAMLDHLASVVAEFLGHYGARIARVEAHLTDVHGNVEPGYNGVHCTLAAHSVGRDPVEIKQCAATAWMAIHSALRKLSLSLANEFVVGAARHLPSVWSLSRSNRASPASMERETEIAECKPEAALQ